MSDLTGTDVSVTISWASDIELLPGPAVGGKRAFATLTFGDSSKTYPTYGIPVPDVGLFNFNYAVPPKWIDFLQPINGYLYTYDPTVRANAAYGTIRIIVISSGAEFSGAPAATTLKVAVLGK